MAGRRDEEYVMLLQRSFRLTTYEAKVYLALLKGASSPREASTMSGVPLPRVYDVIKVLESKGLAVPSSEGWYRYVPPRAAAVAEIARIEEESRSKAKMILEVAEMLEREVGIGGSQAEPVSIESPYQAIGIIVDAMPASQYVYLNVLYVLRENVNIVKAIVSEARRLGRSVYIIASPPLNIDQNSGARVYETPTPMPDAIILSTRALFLYPGGPTGVRGFVVNDPSYIDIVVDRLKRAISEIKE